MPRERRLDSIKLAQMIVGWRKGEYAQLGVERNGQTPLFTDPQTGEHFYGFHATLDEDDITWLIKTLPRARRALRAMPERLNEPGVVIQDGVGETSILRVDVTPAQN
jgi:hypothetical protein